ncbi:Di-and tricarboxylate transporter [Methylobacterium sp. 174MFSha1.1]|uniref:SLC13 family permease n=1 Tax=Methylobacterium sp. 174MFSha1.1 TaxID=1502749 RepID=UPI0008EFF9A7|nr:SLC13 family permease [Methylobacterium sp. 174MFSha1.1]SFV13456.1 Di-and tricarboxylate transporter [Methylobacterium sp. 174MFSha1.1]
MTMTLAGGLALPALLAAATIGLWAFALLPEFLTALLFFAAATTLRLAPPEVVFSGFSSSAFWLVLSGFVIGTAIRKVGLADRVAGLAAPHLAGSWPALVAGTVGLTYALAFVMPSNMGRIAVLMPVVMALADRAGLATQGDGKEGRGRAGLALAVGFGTFQLSASILPANVPNLVMAGAAESAYGIHLSYLPYLALHAPVLGLLKGAVLAGCIIRLFAPGPLVPATAGPAPGPMSAAEKRLAILLVATLALWMTDSVHGVPAAWIGLASACLCLMPRVGFLTGDEFATGVNVRTCLTIAGILGFAAFVTRTGLGDQVGEAVLPWLPLDPARPAASFAGLVGLTTLLNFVVTANGIPALFTPLARLLAEGSGLSLATVLMVQVIGYATPLLPYQASPIVVAMGMGRVPARDGALLCLAVAAVTFVVLVPLDYLWFRALGRL